MMRQRSGKREFQAAGPQVPGPLSALACGRHSRETSEAEAEMRGRLGGRCGPDPTRPFRP